MSSLGGGLRPVDWTSVKLERFEKNFYAEDKRVSTRSEREIDDFRRLKEIKVTLLNFALPIRVHLQLRFKVVVFLDLSQTLTRQDFRSI